MSDDYTNALNMLLTSQNIDKLKSALTKENEAVEITSDCEKAIDIQKKIDLLCALSPCFESDNKVLLNKIITSLRIIKDIYNLLDNLMY